jgi:dienelactone hydrolase
MTRYFFRIVAACLYCALLAPLVRAQAQNFEVTDQPLDLKDATGQTAEWLKAFAHEPETFTYTVTRTAKENGLTVHHVKYPSPFQSPFPENNTVPGELYLPNSADSAKVPAAIVLDILQGNAVLPRMMARRLASEGIAAMYISMPYYNARRPKNGAHERMVSDDPRQTLQVLRQCVMDIRRAKAILASRPEIDSEKVGITGISLGAIATALAAGVDGDFYRVVPILGGGDIASIIFKAPETRRIREILPEKGISQADLEQIFAPVEPLNFASRIEPDRCLMINAERDATIPKANAEALARAIGGPTMIWSPLGHVDSAIYLPNILQKTADFFNGKAVKSLRFEPPQRQP